MNQLSDLFDLFLPPRCAACGGLRPRGMRFLCPACEWEMPATGYCTVHDNPVYRKFYGLVPLAEASSLIFYTSHSRYRRMIHDMKYHGQWRQCRHFGHIMGAEMKKGGLYDSADMIVPIPLHPRRLLTRGYNQAAYIAHGMAQGTGLPVVTGAIRRKRHNPSQTKTSRMERWDNVHGIFTVRDGRLFENKHVILVDDVLTTGATLVSCAETILEAAPSARISVVTLAVSSYELFPSKP